MIFVLASMVSVRTPLFHLGAPKPRIFFRGCIYGFYVLQSLAERMTFDTNVSKVRLRLLLTKVKQNCIVILPYFGLNYNFLWYCFFRQIYIIITYYVIFFVLRFFSWQKGVQSSVDCTPFLRFQHLKIPYYFYYFFWKSRATVAHFFGTVISLFFPTASTFFGRVVYARGP